MIDVERVVTLDELMDRVPEHLVRDAEARRAAEEEQRKALQISKSGNMSKEPSKAQRIRSFLEANPEARNKDVVAELEKYNVTAADVANVKSNMKRSEAASPAPRKKADAAPPSSSASGSVSIEGGPSLNLRHLEAAVDFVKLVGSVQAAQHLLIIVDRVKGA